MQRRGSIIVIIVLLLIAGGLWQWRANDNPNRAFWDMLSNNLSTRGVTRVVTQSSGGLSVTQYTQLSLGTQPTAHALTVFTQNSGQLVTEEISDQTHDLIRYRKIHTGNLTSKQQAAAGQVTGRWAPLGSGQTVSSSLTSGLFNQSMLGVLPMANLSPENQTKLLDTMRTTDVFTYDSSQVKRVTVDGHAAYQYAVKVKPGAYVALMQQFEKLVGARTYAGLDPNSYGSAQPININLAVDTHSHQLLRLDQTASGHTETYQAFGATSAVQLPKATLTLNELTRRLAALQQ